MLYNFEIGKFRHGPRRHRRLRCTGRHRHISSERHQRHVLASLLARNEHLMSAAHIVGVVDDPDKRRVAHALVRQWERDTWCYKLGNATK